MVSESEIFRTPATPYALIEARRSSQSLGLVALMVIVALAVMSFADMRFAIVALMVVCIVVPMVLLLAWLRLTATKEMQLHIRPQRWKRIDGDTLGIEFYPFSASEEDDPQPLTTVYIHKDNITRIESIKHYHVVHLEEALPNTYRFFLIPTRITKDTPSLLLNL